MAFDWKALVKSIAPTIGTALGGPLGGVAGLALSKALGIGDDASKDENALSAAVQGANPDQLLSLKKADQDFAVQMQKLGFENIEALESIAAADRANAREREIKTQDWTPKALGISITLGFFGLLYYLLRHEPPNGSRDILNIMLGSLGSAWIGVVSYYFGSSAGSARKTELLSAKQQT
jgi:zinc transporter ZupT